MNCSQIKNYLEMEFTSGAEELPQPVREHLVACAGCRAYFESLAALRNSINLRQFKLRAHELDDLTLEKIKSLEGEAETKAFPSPAFPYLRKAWIPAVAAVAILLVVLIPRFLGIPYFEPYSEYLADWDVIDSLSGEDSTGEAFSFAAESYPVIEEELQLASELLLLELGVDEQIEDLSKDELEMLYERIGNLNGGSG